MLKYIGRRIRYGFIYMARAEKEGVGSMPPVIYERLGLTDTFTHSVTSALHSVIMAPENADLVGRFRGAYEAREEQNLRVRTSDAVIAQNVGLIEALRETLVTYVPEFPHTVGTDNLGPFHPVGPNWREDLDKAARDVADDKLVITRFASTLAALGLDPTSLSVSDLASHITAAMACYCRIDPAEASPELW
jgi:hypothetical protein